MLTVGEDEGGPEVELSGQRLFMLLKGEEGRKGMNGGNDKSCLVSAHLCKIEI